MEKDTELQRQEGLGDDWISLNLLLAGMCDMRPLADSVNRALLKGDAVSESAVPPTDELVDAVEPEVSEVNIDSILTSHVTGSWTIRPECAVFIFSATKSLIFLFVGSPSTCHLSMPL